MRLTEERNQHETARVHIAHRRRDRCVAARGARAAAGDAGGWVCSSHICRNQPREPRHFPPRPGGNRLHRRQELGDRVPVGTRSKRSVPCAANRIGPPSSIRDRCTGEYEWCACSKSGDPNDPDCFYAGRRPGQDRPSRCLNRPGGNLTGFGLLSAETAAKRLELLLELVPKATSIGYLRNPTNPAYAEAETREVQAAATAHGLRLLTANASSPSEIETAFADLLRQGIDALQVSSDGFLLTHPDQIVALAARHGIPAIYAWRQFIGVGGLMSYGTNIRDGWRQA